MTILIQQFPHTHFYSNPTNKNLTKILALIGSYVEEA